MSQPPEIRTGLITLLFTEFDLKQPAPVGTSITLEIRVTDQDGCVSAQTVASYVVLA
jgi:hypothetical protein